MRLDFPRVGELIGGAYQLEGVLGRGGWAVVFEALQLRMRRTVAIKILAPQYAENALTLKRFEQEALLATHLRHPNIIELYDTGRTLAGLPYIVMERLSGRTVKDLIHEHHEGVSTRRMIHIARQILQALDAAHAQGVLHRDIKPSNIFLCAYSGTDDYVKLLDFGIAKIFSPAEGSALEAIDTVQLGGGIVGSPRYMAPEAFKELPLTPASDLFSMGLVMAELLGGRPVMEGDTELEVIGKLCSEQAFEFVESVRQSPVFPVIETVLQKDPARRYGSARAMLEALNRLVGGSATDLPTMLDLGATAPLETARAAAMASGQPLEGDLEAMETFAFNTQDAIEVHEAREQAGVAAKHGGAGVSNDSLKSTVPGRTRNMGRDGRREAASEALERVPSDRALTEMFRTPPEPPKPKFSGSGLWIGVVVAVLAVLAGLMCLGGVVMVYLLRANTPAPMVEPVTVAAPMPAPVAALSQRVSVTSEPAGATVRSGGEDLGVTPLVLDPGVVGAPGGRLRLTLERDGYATEALEVDVSSGGDQAVVVTLVPLDAGVAEGADEDDEEDEGSAPGASADLASDAGRAPAGAARPGGAASAEGGRPAADKASRPPARAGQADAKKPVIKGGSPTLIPKLD